VPCSRRRYDIATVMEAKTRKAIRQDGTDLQLSHLAVKDSSHDAFAKQLEAAHFGFDQTSSALARFQRDWHQPPRRDCHRKSRTAISRVQYPKGIAPCVVYRKGPFKDLPWPTNGGMPSGYSALRPQWHGKEAECRVRHTRACSMRLVRQKAL
jgi:hypothetical protein